MRLRVMTHDDIPEGMRLKELAGWNQTSSDWERFLDASPKGCFVAEAGGCVVGTATTIVYEERFAWIGMVLVDPEVRGRGIGTRLLGRAIEHLEEQRVPAMKLDATPQGRPLYAKLGFAEEYEIERWVLQREAVPNGSAKAASLYATVAGDPYVVDEIAEFDRQVFGADRTTLLRSLEREAPAFTLLVQRPDGAAGYALGRQGSRADHLGPWVARDESSAAELLAGFLRRSTAETVFVDCMKSNSSAVGLVRSWGFEFSRPLTRMVRGANNHPGRPEMVAGILGPEFG